MNVDFDTPTRGASGTCPNCGYCRHCGRGGDYWGRPWNNPLPYWVGDAAPWSPTIITWSGSPGPPPPVWPCPPYLTAPSDDDITTASTRD